MNVTVKSVAIRPPAPPNQEREIDVPEGASVTDALLKFGLENPDAHATLLNDEPIPAGKRAATKVAAGDVLTVFPPIHGG